MGRLIILSILSAELMWDESHIVNVHVDFIYTLEPRDDWRTCDCWNFQGISIPRAAIARVSGTRGIDLNMVPPTRNEAT